MNVTLLTQGHCKHSSNSWHRYLRVQQARGIGLLWMQFERRSEVFMESALQSASCPAPGSASLISPNFGALKLHAASWHFVPHNSRALPALPWQFTACTVPNTTKKGGKKEATAMAMHRSGQEGFSSRMKPAQVNSADSKEFIDI